MAAPIKKMPRSLLKRAQTGWLVQATDQRKLNEPPRPRLQRNGTIYLMARPPLLCQGGDFAFPSGCPRRLCPADDLWVMISPLGEGAAKRRVRALSTLFQIRMQKFMEQVLARFAPNGQPAGGIGP